MSQLTTLQDLYKEIADIHDKLCNLSFDLETHVVSDIKLENYKVSSLEFDNPDDKADIYDAENEINSLYFWSRTH